MLDLLDVIFFENPLVTHHWRTCLRLVTKLYDIRIFSFFGRKRDYTF